MGTSADLLGAELIGGVNRCNYNQDNLQLNALAGKQDGISRTWGPPMLPRPLVCWQPPCRRRSGCSPPALLLSKRRGQ